MNDDLDYVELPETREAYDHLARATREAENARKWADREAHAARLRAACDHAETTTIDVTTLGDPVPVLLTTCGSCGTHIDPATTTG